MAYRDIDPSLVDRIVGMAEASVHGRHEVAVRAVKAEAFAVRLGALAAAVVAVGGLVAAVALLVLGYEVSALVTAVPAVLLGVARVVSAARLKGE